MKASIHLPTACCMSRTSHSNISHQKLPAEFPCVRTGPMDRHVFIIESVCRGISVPNISVIFEFSLLGSARPPYLVSIDD